ncbi:Pre-mRNA_splicing factor RNA helicase [Hexamita inflata]|uniref:Pre-mRNA splicing factor RNA helicase n=1 Tax=Hexamita inflata TaxID=28002 RepID=A0AA86N3P9_9EUKA|nr:Pre-mRNA splicing factor RNA helicase [Hexamita inflata]
MQGNNNGNDQQQTFQSEEEFYAAVKTQIEYYFSDQNLMDDIFMIQYLTNHNQMYDITEMINTFKKLQKLNPTKQQAIYALRDSEILQVVNGDYFKRIDEFDVQNSSPKQLRVWGYRTQDALIKVIQTFTGITPFKCKFIKDAGDLPHYSLVTFNTQQEAEQVYIYFGCQTDFTKKKYRKSFSINVKVNQVTQAQLRQLKSNLIVLRSDYYEGPQIAKPKQIDQKTNYNQILTLIGSIQQYKWPQSLQNNIYCKQSQQIIIDILNNLPKDQLFTSLTDLLQEKIFSILAFIEDLQAVTQANSQQWVQIVNYLNSFLNALVNKVDVTLEIRMFCFGKSMLPLPVYQLRNRVLQNRGSPFTILQSSTGSGKTTLFPAFMTQLPQAKINRMKIFITQPTSLTVRQIAKTINEKIICGMYKISTNPYDSSDICVCTPLQIIKMISQNPEIIKTSMFVLDEFHTRTIALDVLFAKLIENSKYLTQPYQFVMMSATPDQDIVSQLPQKEQSDLIMKIENCSPFNITQIRVKANSVKEAVATVPAKQAVDFIHEMVTKQKPIGNILCFTSGKKECEDICEQTIQGLKENKNVVCVDFSQFKNMNVYAVHEELRKISAKSDKLVVVPIVMAGQATELEKTIASDPIPEDFSLKCIKVIAATNIAETSITIEDLVCLIDSGMFKEASWDDKKGIRILKEKQISAAQRTQRVGRVGRVRDGFAYLIDVDQSQKVEQQKPEISRIDLKQTILELKNMNIHLEEIYGTLPTQPDIRQVQNALSMLQIIKAIDVNRKITVSGKRLLDYKDISPFIGYIFEEILQKSKIDLVISIIAYCITIGSNDLVYNNFTSKIAQQCFIDESDVATLVKCFICIEKQSQKDRKQYCKDNGFSFTAFVHSRSQIQQIFQSIIENNPQYEYQSLEVDDSENSSSDAETVVSNSTNREDSLNKFIKSIQDNQILPALDFYVLAVSKLQNLIQPNTAQKQYGQFNTISNIVSKPRYLFDASSILADKDNVVINCFDRPGSQTIVAYSSVYFYDIQYNETQDMYIGKYMHRLPNSYKKCDSIKVVQNSFSLPYSKLLFNKMFKEHAYYNFMNKMHQRIILNTTSTEYFAETQDKQYLYYTIKQQLTSEQNATLQATIQKLIELSAKCPSTLISRYPGLKDFYVEYKQTDNYCDAEFIRKQSSDENKAPFAYQFNLQSIVHMMNNPNDCRISFVFDLMMDTSKFKDFGYQNDWSYTGDTVIKIQNNNVINQLIIISDKQIPSLKQLKWFDQSANSYYSAYVDEDYKFNILSKNCVKGISATHTENELMFQQVGSQIYLTNSKIETQKDQSSQDQENALKRILNQDINYQEYRKIEMEIKKQKSSYFEQSKQLNDLYHQSTDKHRQTLSQGHASKCKIGK